MRDRDKNDWYDPKTFRSDRPIVYPPPVSGGIRIFGSLLIWLLIGAALLFIVESYWTPPAWAPTPTRACPAQPLPASGTTGILDPAVMRRSDVLFSAIEITNNYSRPLAAYLLSPADASKRYAVVHIAPGAVASVSAPVGTYGVLLAHGSHWCGDEKGYLDGHRLRLTTQFQNEPGKTGRILIGQAGNDTPSVAYSHSTPEPPPPLFAVSGIGALDLLQDARGHYAIDGNIDGTSLQFMLDTGATITSVSNDFALRARIPSCRPTTTNTANGVTNACLARVADLSFGHFRVRDVDVMILPRLSGSEALLGMNVLRHFSIEQRGGAMRISPP